MIVETGHYALVLALVMALAQSIIPFLAANRQDQALLRIAPRTAIATFILVAVSFVALTWAYVTSDFSVLNVLQNSHTSKPLIYKITGVWANHEGSMLLWILILALFGASVSAFGGNLPPTLLARVVGVMGLIAFGFLLFILLTSNPFERVFNPPLDGQGMNPLLQDPGIAIHPPFLYLGYVGFSVAFSFAIAALIEGRVDPAWARWVRPWTLAAWVFLTAGIGLGSWWAYYELGWGGWWFWDPVENASFMPWLAGTALLHSAIVVEKRDALKSWSIFLAIIAFSFSLLGTFLVRSGALTSVHAFATDPTRGVFILILLCLTVGGSFALYAWRAPTLKGGGLFQPISREGALVFNNILLSIAAAMVLLGTLYPLLLETVTGEKISVGEPFFNMTFVPIMTPVIIAMAIGPLLPWKRADLFAAIGKLKIAIASVVVVVLVTFWLSGGPAFALFGMGLAIWLFVGSMIEWANRIKLFREPLGTSLRRMRNLPRAAHGTMLAHVGVAIVVAGITGSQAWTTESVQSLAVGESTEIAGYTFELSALREYQGPNFAAREGTVTVSRPGEAPVLLYPEKRVYTVEAMPTTEAGIRSSFTGDIYAVLGDQDSSGKWVTRFYVKPMIPWMWAGGLVMVLGGLMSLSDRRYRVGAPTRSHKTSPAAKSALPAE
ncbi:heme lyase CcmF/NrfE family subunit [Thalassospira sp.]|uniref:heme lyase CcmF/NrfE family subunit n=1 Tax=Thalassospira sp. TaxID=1912094 RepID=UPI00273259B3|nr:heme lyase CcmF/NrfE family subunit [Thalassospira sp.]MDP2699503.1 heme lyase CcmF/NrfE family subunit [Thalassospira sp.]